ncbi:MAG: DNA polymerase III subunit alpha [Clostridia bacterium]|nr:DNA polymerase III subunit alpha [Clostridia bacterium]
MADFVHLHLYSEYSLLNGACRIKELVNKVKSLEQSAVAITDRGVLFGAVEFYKECEKQGVKPIIGCEMPTGEVLLCKDNEGYHNLVKIVSEVNNETVKDIDTIPLYEKYKKGIIVLSGGIEGEIFLSFLNGDYDRGIKRIEKLKSIFNQDFYLEICDYGDVDSKTVLSKIITISNEYNVELVATNNVFYVDQNDQDIYEILRCISKGTTLKEYESGKGTHYNRHILCDEEVNIIFSHIPNAIENTKVIADKCNVKLEFGVKKLPEYKIGTDHFEYLKDLCRKGMVEKYGRKPSTEIIDRIKYELDTIHSMGYVDYYLIVWDFINYARSKGISVGPGRGSGAGSIVAYLIGITGIDPIKYNLIFERFLNPERVSMPDFDIDFCYVRRHEVIDYLYEKYGHDHVAQIVTFGTLAARAAVRDVGRVMDLPNSYVDTIAKLVPNELGVTLERALEISEDLRRIVKEDYNAKTLINTAKRIEGLPRHTSTHAAGVVITGERVENFVPVTQTREGMMTQYTMTLLEELGLLKIDLLGLRNLTIIDDAVKLIKNNNPSFSVENIPLDDKKTLDMFSKGKTEGVFQFESDGMKSVLRRLKPISLEDLIAVISLYRPGPRDSIPQYIQNRHNPNNIKYLTPELKPILEVTYGCLVYQEQVMQVFRDLAGYSFGRADIVRRAMSKKKHDVMENERATFVKGAKDRGISENVSNKIFDDMTSFASYAFNKSHAAAYALVSYRTAWLKANYPLEYMSALFTSVCGNTEKTAKYAAECASMGIKLYPPNVNKSQRVFAPFKDGIIFPLSAVKNVGTMLSDSVVNNRNDKGEFSSIVDFCNKVNGRELNAKSLEWIAKCGAFDDIEKNRKMAFLLSEKVLNNLQNRSRFELKGQINLFGNEKREEVIENVDCEDYTLSEKISFENTSVGIAFSRVFKQPREIPKDTENPKQNKYHGLHIRLSSESCAERVKVENLLSIFEGTTPVYFKFEDTNKRVMLPRSMFISYNEPLMNQLRKLLGDENVVFLK